MEIIEIITYHLNDIEEVLEVSFRTNSDDEETYREDKISYTDIDDFGYNFHSEIEDIEFYDEYEISDDDIFVDDNEILSFLNEYYVLFPNKLPKPDYF